MVSTYCDHVPLYLQERVFARQGVRLLCGTVDGWLGELSGLPLPIVEAVKKRLLSESFLRNDDTRIQVQDRALEGETRRRELRVYRRPDEEIVYRFTEDRSSRGPEKILAGFSGHLQSRGFSGYNPLWASGRVKPIG